VDYEVTLWSYTSKDAAQLLDSASSVRVINSWDRLPQDVVEATSVNNNMFKNCLDKHLKDYGRLQLIGSAAHHLQVQVQVQVVYRLPASEDWWQLSPTSNTPAPSMYYPPRLLGSTGIQTAGNYAQTLVWIFKTFPRVILHPNPANRIWRFAQSVSVCLANERGCKLQLCPQKKLNSTQEFGNHWSMPFRNKKTPFPQAIVYPHNFTTAVWSQVPWFTIWCIIPK